MEGMIAQCGKDTKINHELLHFQKVLHLMTALMVSEYYENLYEYMYNNGMITVNDNYKSFNEDYLTSDITTEELDKGAGK